MVRRKPKHIHGIEVGEITYKKPGNGLPQFVKEAAEQRGYGDALQPLSLYITEQDIDAAFQCAAQGNGAKCVMAQAGQRLGAKSVYFYRTTAWVDFGEGPILRFMTPKVIHRNVIEPFDKGRRKSIISGVYPLMPATPSNTIASRRDFNQPDRKARTNKRAKKRLVVQHSERVVMASSQDGE